MDSLTVPAGKAPYPVSFDADYPERQSRWKALFRLPLSIPVLLFSALLSYALYGALWLLWIIILLRGRIPRWLFDFVVGLSRGIARASAYFSLLTDQYPPFEGDHPVHFEVRYAERTSRWKLVIWKIITSVPHLLVMEVLRSASLAVLPIAWIAIIFTGRFPKGLHEFVTSVLRWQQRVTAYLLSLTDEFPPFSLSADAGAGSGRSLAFSAVLGLVLTAGAIGGITALVIAAGPNEQVVSVSYDRLVNGRVLPGETAVLGDSMVLSLNRARDPADPLLSFLEAEQGRHFVGFEMTIRDTKHRDLWFEDQDFRLDDSKGNSHHPFLALVNKRTLPEKVLDGAVAATELVFEVDDGATPAELHYDATGRRLKTLVYKFEGP